MTVNRRRFLGFLSVAPVAAPAIATEKVGPSIDIYTRNISAADVRFNRMIVTPTRIEFRHEGRVTAVDLERNRIVGKDAQ